MKILIADSVSNQMVEELRGLGAEVVQRPDATADDLPETIGDAEVLIVRSTKVTRATIEAGEALSLVVRAGAGVNTIDVDAAAERGVFVSNCPGKNTDAVAELTMGLVLALDRSIVDATYDLRAGRWRKKHFGSGRGLKGRVLGVVGFGAIGRAVARRAAAFQMSVAAWSRSLTPEAAAEAGVAHHATIVDLARVSDVLSVHVAGGEGTRHLVSTQVFDALRPGSIFVNTSRGEVVDTAAMAHAIDSKGIRVGLDVFEDEPAGGDAAFPAIDLAQRVYATPHIGASTAQASEAIAEEAVRVVRTYLHTGTPANAVNHQDRSPGKTVLVVRQYNRVGVLAEVLSEIRAAGINVEEMDNRNFDGGHAAACTMKLDGVPSHETLERIRANPNIIRVVVKQIES